MMKPTLQDIADYAGVSRGTVDRVLHNRPKVSEENRKRVEEALRKLHYSPNPAARSLALSAKNNLTIGVLFPPWTSFYHSELVRGVEGAKNNLRDYGLNVLVRRCAAETPEEWIREIDSLVAEGVRGLAVCARSSVPVREKLLSLSRKGVPVVTFNSDIPDCGRICFVGQDEERSGRIAGDIMFKLLGGKAKVLVVYQNLEFVAQKNRIDGFAAAFAERGAEDGICPAATVDDYDITYGKVLERLRSVPDIAGLYLASCSVAGAVAAVADAGLQPRVRIVCHDVPPTTANFLRKRVVDFAVDQNMYRQGSTPVSVLADYLLGGKRPEREIAYAAVQIVGPENLPE